MSKLTPAHDTPDRLVRDGRNIDVKLTKLGNGTAAIEWNIPAGLMCADNQMAYNGAIVTLSLRHVEQADKPSDGTVYESDNTADFDMSLGDVIGEARVVASLYNDTTTNRVIVTNVDEHTAYYASVYAVDNVNRYHTGGSHSYSLNFGGKVEPDEAGYQDLNFNCKLTLTSPTGFVPTTQYSFKIQQNGTDHEITFLGSDAPTVEDFIRLVNRQSRSETATVVSATAPLTDTLVLKNNKLYKFNGTTYVEAFMTDDTIDPTSGDDGALWVRSVVMKNINSVWVAQPTIITPFDILNPECGNVLVTDARVYRYDGAHWIVAPALIGYADPTTPKPVSCSTFWMKSPDRVARYDTVKCKWTPVQLGYMSSVGLPGSTFEYKYNELTDELHYLDPVTHNYTVVSVTVSATPPTLNDTTAVRRWYNPTTKLLSVGWADNKWTSDGIDCLINLNNDDAFSDGDLWYVSSTNVMYSYEAATNSWLNYTDVRTGSVDPTAPQNIPQGTLWVNHTDPFTSNVVVKVRDGSTWTTVLAASTSVVGVTTVDDIFIDGVYMIRTDTKAVAERVAGAWVDVYVRYKDPDAIRPVQDGDYWKNGSIISIYSSALNGWSPVTYSVDKLVYPTNGTVWLNSTTQALRIWNGVVWAPIDPIFTMSLNGGNIRITDGVKGNASLCGVIDRGNVWITSAFTGFKGDMKVTKGLDGLDRTPMSRQLDVGTDGSDDERKQLIQAGMYSLGYPSVQVELTREQWDMCVDNALETFRQRSSNPYKRCAFFVDIEPRKQVYKLTDKAVGSNKIVDVMYVYRMSGSFLGVGAGTGMYGQMVVQQLYNMGKFDLVSYHLVSSYVELMREMFASEIQFNWDANRRELRIFKDFYGPERVLLDAYIERTEQDLITDRLSRQWIMKWMVAEAREILAEVRGKFSSVAGANGSISLNASDLRAKAKEDKDQCLRDIEDYVAADKNEFGVSSDMVWG